ncbi:hypothetical protein [Pseudomonas viridiflava]|uniref:hypothetical protein n=1 Tax=Pseudomonas viridiflava TaxID=33069 RepID=UPI000F044076|nr:hypothetical protein [Pseudomonas viridiflava]
MPDLNLVHIHPGAADDHIFLACERYSAMAGSTWAVEDHLAVAESLSEQILAHYGSLRKASEGLKDFCSEGKKLPDPVLHTFLYACAREHPMLSIIMDELFELYEHEDDPEVLKMIRMTPSSKLLKGVMRPYAWDVYGVLKHNPASLNRVHPKSIHSQLSEYFAKGAWMIERLFETYPDMSEGSRRFIDNELGLMVCSAGLREDNPLRVLLQDKIDPVVDAKHRIRRTFEFDINNAPDSEFTKSLEFCFELLDRLQPAQVKEAFEELTYIIGLWVGEDAWFLSETHQPLEAIRELVSKAQGHGFDVIGAIQSHMEGRADDRDELLQLLVENFDDENKTGYVTDGLIMEAALLTIDDKTLVKLKIPEVKLARIADLTGSQALRSALKASPAGREILFGQDLGL